MEAFLDGRLNRAAVELRMARDVPIDAISGNQFDLLTNCEYALRHINEAGYWTTELELRYYLDCLRGRKQFSTAERNALLVKRD